MKIEKVALGAALLCVCVATAGSAQEFTMRVSVPSASSGPICTQQMQGWADRVHEASNGRIVAEVVCDSILSRPGDTVTRVVAGVADAGWDLPNVYGARFAHYGVVGVPGIVNDAGHAAAAMWQLHETGVFPPIEGIRLVAFQTQNTVRMWTRHEMADPTDLNGMRVISGSSLRGNTIAAMNGVPLSLRVPEYYQSLARGAADGVMTNAAAFADYSFYDMIPYGYIAPWGAGLTMMFVSQAWYDRLPDDLKAVIDSLSGSAESVASSVWFAEYEAGRLATLAEQNLIHVSELTEDQLAALAPAFQSVTDSWIASTEGGAGYLEAFMAAYAAAEATN